MRHVWAMAVGVCVMGWITVAGVSRAAEREEVAEMAPRTALPAQPFASMPTARISVDLKQELGALELWRHTVGHGGINVNPLPDRVVAGAARLRPRLIRIFVQEFFAVYPEHGKYDWSRLDPYMDSMARTGAKVVAAITIKPKPLYPKIDQTIWKPNDVEEWQRVIAAMVKRYSVDKPIVTYWEIGNETDIGENGGCPYLISDPRDYAEYYKMTIKPILATFPQAKVGGTAVANAGGDYLPKFIESCRKDGTRLDFVSWHLYSDDPGAHAGLVGKYRKLLEGFPGKRPEMLVTEWSKGFDSVSVEDMAFDARRAAITAACILSMTEAGVDWSFYYHLWDQVCYLDAFKPFFQNPDIMYHHWNEVPHRFGLFGVGGEVRPQYFVYEMLGRMGGQRVASRSDAADMRVLASREGENASVIMVNHGQGAAQDRLTTIRIAGLTPGRKHLVVYRIDRQHAWSAKAMELVPVERREVDVESVFTFQVYCPAESVAQVLVEGR